MKPVWKDRIKAQPLWFWGFCFCFGGIFANLAMMMIIDSGDLRRSEAREAQLGAAVAGGILIVIGMVFFVRHFLRRKR
ncbi:MAG: hypothetical protein ACPGVU_24140 [Limisphaerales bacterium]